LKLGAGSIGSKRLWRFKQSVSSTGLFAEAYMSEGQKPKTKISFGKQSSRRIWAKIPYRHIRLNIFKHQPNYVFITLMHCWRSLLANVSEYDACGHHEVDI
jgi:hypothetical protein